ncbi:protein MpWDL [Marchantia polymorpha subsp. ruderalis]|uniref:TPX2 C-terminal domain-containing protein n=2 Tax=Marchantia polymorpha TaxID=3197 RepID=A0A176VI50_MARPO|nr:wave-dampened 2-like protein [Marchantia polymorpha]OAE20619.1 hypothetical protein AXG93_517s1340 [Marchantia polymorpha subsp. ruderalis]PTQ37426.1 hypothetical protein MARPO_0057s0061 [Marchantia polymorpha]BBN16416.1 hypothetical protein Mp_7g06100 [Marchantia polymorpha subsp. ruderalis]|eukprot:PTQ37426.1 hypothetical protein MARPO_0057s0061 [Marchantia polymorpha]
MSEAGGNEQDVTSVARTLDFSLAESGHPDGMNVDQAVELDTGEAGNSVAVHHDDEEEEDGGALQNLEEGGEEKGEEKHVISHGAEKAEHLNASSLREDEFQKLLLLAEEFEADEKTGDDGEDTGNMEGVDEGKGDSGNKEDRDGKGLALKVKPGAGKTQKTGAAPNRKGPTPVARVSKVRPSTVPITSGKNDKTEIDGTPKRKRHGEEGAVDSESRSLPTTPSVNRTSNGTRKLTVPQPFALATDKRASLGGRPTDGDLASRLALPSLKKAPAPAKLTSKLFTKPSEGPKRYEQGTGKVKNATSSSEDDPRSGSLPYPALKIKANQPPVTSASSFQFKCDERAEKRREFYNKLEERLSAKEAEKTQIEAKTQEEIEAKIKELRKSLTFKANPMPSFYQEAPPPKVEIKKIPTTRAKSPKLGTSRRSSGVGTMMEDARSCRTSRTDLEHKLNGLSDDGQNKDIKKALKKPSALTKALSDKTMRSAKSNGRLDNSKAQAAASSGVGETDAKPKENKVTVSDSAGDSDEGKTNNAEAAQDTIKDDAAPVGDSVTSDGSNGLNEKDGSGGASEKASRPSQSSSSSASEEGKDKIVKTTKQKLKASTPTLSSAAKRETPIKHSSKNSTEIAHSAADVAVAS